MDTPRISAYLTTYNCWTSQLPFLAALKSLLRFCFEVVVCDGGSDDGTWENLVEVARREERVRLLRYPLDKRRPSWALDLDQWLKAKGRRACRGDYCWQADADEILTEDDGRKIFYCLDYLSEQTPILAVPHLEYWGGIRYVRRDLYPAAPKLSLNRPWITHGLPRGFRAHDEHGVLYALPYASLSGSYLDCRTLEMVPCWSLLPDDVESLRQSREQTELYVTEFYDCLDDLPVVHHLSWCSIEAKLRRLRDSWTAFSASYYRVKDPISASPFFDSSWDRVTDADISRRAAELQETGPGVLSGETAFPTLMPAKKELPADIRRWLERKEATRQVACVL